MFWSQPNPCANTRGWPPSRPPSVTLFRRNTRMEGRRAYSEQCRAATARGRYNGGVTTEPPGDADGGRQRPTLITPEVRLVFAVWCGITVFLVVIYVLVLLLL